VRRLLAIVLCCLAVVLAPSAARADAGTDAAIADAGAEFDADAEALAPASEDVADAPPQEAPAPSSPEEPGGPAIDRAPKAGPPADRTALVAKNILGLVVLLALPLVGAHPSVRAIERKLGVAQLITAGLPFVILGVVARHPAIGVLGDDVLATFAPVLRIGLGWVGFLIGFRFDTRGLDTLPTGTASLVIVRATLTTLLVGGSAALILMLIGSDEGHALREALILGAAATATSLSVPRLLTERGAEPAAVDFVSRLLRLEELVGLVGLLCLVSYFRPAEAARDLPGTVWLVLTVGLGAVIGVVVYVILLRRTQTTAESTVLLLGSVSFAAGMAGYLRLSPVVVCFVVGLLLGNFPGPYKEAVHRSLARVERPIYLAFLVVVGAIWDVTAWRGWVLLSAFLLCRVVAKGLGLWIIGKAEAVEVPASAARAITIAPIGALSIAIVVNAWLLYPQGAISPIVTVILGGAIMMEIASQLTMRVSDEGPR
jgi:hypothetical protein